MKSELLAERTMDRPLPLKKLIVLSFMNWLWFLVSALVVLGGTLTYLRYATPTFKIKASVLVRDDTKGSDFGDAIGIQGLDLPIGKSNVDNEVEVLRSRSLAESVVDSLQLYVKYFSSGDVKTSEIYDQRPVILRFIRLNKTLHKKESQTYEIRPAGKNKVSLIHSGITRICRFNDTLTLPHGQAIILRTQSPFVEENKYTIRVEPMGQAVGNYQKTLAVNPVNKMVSMISLSWVDKLPEKGEAIINQHLKTYLQNSIVNKTRIADNTIAFINDNLEKVRAEMYNIGQNQTRYQKEHGIADLSESARALIQDRVRLIRELADNSTEQKVLHALHDHIERNPKAMVPKGIIASDATLSELTNQFNESVSQRAATLKDRAKDHPSVIRLDTQISLLSEAINSGIVQYEQTLTERRSVLKEQQTTLLSQIDQIPLKQEALTDYFRKVKIQEELYVFLTRKHLETSLSKSSAQSAGRIVDTARADSLPTYPNKSLTLLIACLVSLAIPTAVIYVRNLTDERIWDKNEVQNLSTAPVLASIGHFRNYGRKEISSGMAKQLTEQFQMLRTHLLQSLTTEKKIIMITSGVKSEGKTFVALHLSETLTCAGKKVLLLELNLRHPMIATHYRLQNKGVTDFLTSDGGIDEIIQSPAPGTSFEVIVAGPIPENPADLLVTTKLTTLIQTISDRYDYIVIDTPPFSLFPDALIITPWADTVLIVVRKLFTERAFLRSMQSWITQKKPIPDINLILNEFEDI